MLQDKKKMFKVLAPLEKKGGGTFWTRCGVAYENRDASINVYLDFFPKDFKFQIRAFDAEDLRRMSERRDNAGSRTNSDASGSSFNLSMPPPPMASGDLQDVPF